MASLNSVLEGPRKAGRSSYFDSFFADSESRPTPVEVQATSSTTLPQPNEGAIAPLLTAEAAELGLKFFRWEERGALTGARRSHRARARARSRLALSFPHSRARRRHPTARPPPRARDFAYGGGPFVPALKTCLLVYRSEERKITIGPGSIGLPPP